MIDIDLKDEWGGIDENIKKAVYSFNTAGFKTAGSCEGHADYGSPVPWVYVAAGDESAGSAVGEVLILKEKNKILFAQVNAAIKEFYADRNMSEELKIATTSGKWGFWIHSDKKAFVAWRDEIDALVVKKEKGEEYIKREISETEKIQRAEKLSMYQAEMEKFAEFVKG